MNCCSAFSPRLAFCFHCGFASIQLYMINMRASACIADRFVFISRHNCCVIICAISHETIRKIKHEYVSVGNRQRCVRCETLVKINLLCDACTHMIDVGEWGCSVENCLKFSFLFFAFCFLFWHFDADVMRAFNCLHDVFII